MTEKKGRGRKETRRNGREKKRTEERKVKNQSKERPTKTWKNRKR